MRLTAFEYGKTEISERMAFQGGNDNVKLPIALLFFLIETDDKKVLVDTGCDKMHGFPLFEFKKPVDVLESYGVSRMDITDVILTHTHGDHIGGVHYYPQANVYVQQNESDRAAPYVKDKSKFFTFDDKLIFCENIEVKHIGGHSLGSSIVCIYYGGKTYVICGDECYVKENLVLQMPTGSSCCIEKSRYFVNEYSKNKYIPILCHDKDIVGEIGFKTIFG